MKGDMPEVSDRSLWSTSEVAKQLGVCKNTVRNWARQGWIRPSHLDIRGRMVFTGMEVKNCYKRVKGLKRCQGSLCSM